MQGYNFGYMASYTEPTVGTTLLMVIVLVVFCAIKLMKALDYFVLLTALLIVSVSIAYEVLALRLMASIYELSSKYTATGRKTVGLKTSHGKEFQSFRSLRINVGSFFVENLTVFAYFDSCIKHTIDVLLLA